MHTRPPVRESHRPWYRRAIWFVVGIVALCPASYIAAATVADGNAGGSGSVLSGDSAAMTTPMTSAAQLATAPASAPPVATVAVTPAVANDDPGPIGHAANPAGYAENVRDELLPRDGSMFRTTFITADPSAAEIGAIRTGAPQLPPAVAVPPATPQPAGLPTDLLIGFSLLAALLAALWYAARQRR